MASDGGDATAGCRLCDLPVGPDPVTGGDVAGEFCCQGCLSVAQRLDEVDDHVAEDATDRAPVSADRLDTGPDAARAEGEDAFLAVEGMHCATCESFLEARATDHDGVRAAEGSYAANLVRVVYDPETVEESALSGVLSGAGYEARLVADAEDADPGHTQQETVGRLVLGGFFGMMVMLWYVVFLYPIYLGVDPATLPLDIGGPAGGYLLGNVWLMSTVVLGYTGYPILRGAYVSLRAGEPNMDLLVALAAVTAWTYSSIALLVGHTEVYFDVSVVVILAVTVGGYYERRVKNRATERLTDLTTDRVGTAHRRTVAVSDGATSGAAPRPDTAIEEVPIEDVAAGDELVVRPGERVPLDGTVIEGNAAVDEALVTGESLPVRKEPGDEAVGGSEVTDGGLVVRVDEGEGNTLDRIAHHLWTVQSGRRGVQRLADRLATVFVPVVVTLAVLATVVHVGLGSAPTAALLTGLAVLVVSCPCALGLATPLSVAAGVSAALERGIVVTDESLFERATEADVVAFDKTGTLTTGDLTLVERPDDDLLADAAAVEAFADHPLAEAVVAAANEVAGEAASAESKAATEAPSDRGVMDVKQYPGRGVGATVDGRAVLVGRPDLFDERDWTVPADLREQFERAREDANVAALAGRDGTAEGLVAAADTPREGWEAVVADLGTDREIVVITGDEGAAADRFREHAAVDEVFAGVPPEGKGELVERLRSRGTVAMVGDGSNDAPALATADVGIALADGAALAAEAADAVVTTGELAAVPTVFDVTRATRARIRQNVGWALCYNAVAVPTAALGLLNPLVAAVAMAGSSLLVVGNASRSILEE
jgi:Cu2+-exporting ATPase